ncbi:unnamed protein product, partial [Prorocentrum cordatum]
MRPRDARGARAGLSPRPRLHRQRPLFWCGPVSPRPPPLPVAVAEAGPPSAARPQPAPMRRGRAGAGTPRARLLAAGALARLLAGAEGAYEHGQDIQVSMNKAWPFQNPTETYKYYDFPFCQVPNGAMPHFMTLGQV